MEYKPSAYNFFVPYSDSRTIVYNSFSGAIGLFDSVTLERFYSWSLDDTEISTLAQKGVIIPIDYNEKKEIDEDRAFGITQCKSKYLRIWTTSACNAQCYYCFEKGLPAVPMNESTADQVVNFIDSMLNCEDELTIEWFGGEPFLNIKIIDYIIEKLTPILHRKKCVFFSTFISNGSLISDEIVEKMATKWSTKQVQITLDGIGETYNAIKQYFRPDLFSFATVINGIHLMAERNIHISIRMNYDTTNYQSLCDLIDYLHSEFQGSKNIFYYVYPVWGSLNPQENQPFVSSTKSDQNVVELFKRITGYHMTPIREIARLNYKKRQCVSCSINSFTIYPNGDLGKCSETFLQIIGDVWKGVVDKETEALWVDTAINEECEECRYLPLCQGGCRSSYFTKMPRCYSYKEILPDILRWYVSTLEKRSTSSN